MWKNVNICLLFLIFLLKGGINLFSFVQTLVTVFLKEEIANLFPNVNSFSYWPGPGVIKSLIDLSVFKGLIVTFTASSPNDFNVLYLPGPGLFFSGIPLFGWIYRNVFIFISN